MYTLLETHYLGNLLISSIFILTDAHSCIYSYALRDIQEMFFMANGVCYLY